MKKKGTVAKIKQFFEENNGPHLFYDIKQAMPDIESWSISMAMNHVVKSGYMTREQVKNERLLARKILWKYTLNPDRKKKKASV